MSNTRATGNGTPNSSQNLIAMLEARIASLENILGVDGSGDINIDADKVNIRGTKVTIESSGRMQLKTYSDLLMEGTTVDLRSSSNMTMNSTNLSMNANNLNLSANGNGRFSATTLEFTSSGIASISGSVTKIGKGDLPVATSSTSVSAVGFTLFYDSRFTTCVGLIGGGLGRAIGN